MFFKKEAFRNLHLEKNILKMYLTIQVSRFYMK